MIVQNIMIKKKKYQICFSVFFFFDIRVESCQEIRKGIIFLYEFSFFFLSIYTIVVVCIRSERPRRNKPINSIIMWSMRIYTYLENIKIRSFKTILFSLQKKFFLVLLLCGVDTNFYVHVITTIFELYTGTVFRTTYFQTLFFSFSFSSTVW